MNVVILTDYNSGNIGPPLKSLGAYKVASTLRSNNIAKKITVKSKQLVFNAFKVLSAFNVFSFIGSFLVEYLIYSDEVDELFKAYKEGYKKGTDNRKSIDKILSHTNQSVPDSNPAPAADAESRHPE